MVNANFRFSGFECLALVDDACFGISEMRDQFLSVSGHGDGIEVCVTCPWMMSVDVTVSLIARALPSM